MTSLPSSNCAGNLEDILPGSQAKWGCSESMRWKTVVPVLPAPTMIIGPLFSITNSSYRSKGQTLHKLTYQTSTNPDRVTLSSSRGWRKVRHSAFHEDKSLPVMLSSFSISVL